MVDGVTDSVEYSLTVQGTRVEQHVQNCIIDEAPQFRNRPVRKKNNIFFVTAASICMYNCIY